MIKLTLTPHYSCGKFKLKSDYESIKSDWKKVLNFSWNKKGNTKWIK